MFNSLESEETVLYRSFIRRLLYYGILILPLLSVTLFLLLEFIPSDFIEFLSTTMFIVWVFLVVPYWIISRDEKSILITNYRIFKHRSFIRISEIESVKITERDAFLSKGNRTVYVLHIYSLSSRLIRVYIKNNNVLKDIQDTLEILKISFL